MSKPILLITIDTADYEEISNMSDIFNNAKISDEYHIIYTVNAGMFKVLNGEEIKEMTFEEFKEMFK